MTIKEFFERWVKIISRKRWDALTVEFREENDRSFGYITHVLQPKSNKLFIMISNREANYTDNPDGIKGTLTVSVFDKWLKNVGISKYGDYELVIRKDFGEDVMVNETAEGYYKVVDVQLDPQERNVVIKAIRQ